MKFQLINQSRISTDSINRFTRNRNFFVLDILLLSLATYLAFVLRLESWHVQGHAEAFAYFLPIVLFITPLALYRVGAYNRYWRYASIRELLLLISSIATAAVLLSVVTLFSHMSEFFPTIPRSVPFIFFLLAAAVVTTPRLLARLVSQYHEQMQHRCNLPIRSATPGTSDEGRLRVVVMGAGSAGAMIVRELQQVAQAEMEVVGFLDDDPTKHKLRIHGVPVLGNRYAIPAVVQQFEVQQVIIAMPAAPGQAVREIMAICEQVGVHTRVIPGLYELIDGKVSVNHVRDVQIEDLLRREPVQTDITAIYELLHGKRVLVTGGGGSIGSELCRQVLRCEPSELVIIGHGENSVFEIVSELQKFIAQQAQVTAEPPCTIHAVIADIRFPNRILRVFEQYRPDIVFHAAAHKHVPLMEYNPAEAITNNVLGTRNLLQAAMAVEVQRFVMISTDKAVNPTSVMGASKRIAELLVHQAAQKSGRAYVAVRFGNVLGSRGSVILTFQKQIASGGPVTVTDPEMRRYFMTIPEAVQLVLQAAVIGQGGEVFTLDMGEQIKIVDLAHDMIELSGLEVGRDIEIAFTGLRPGEKLYEELFTPDEEFQRTTHQKIFIAANASNSVPHHLIHWVDSLAIAADRNDTDAILLVLQRLLPGNQLKWMAHSSEAQMLADELMEDSLEAEEESAMGKSSLTIHYHDGTSEDTLQTRVVGA
jgi:FlaA1/EpsC-like NDP-sugar epimerase